MKVCVLGAGISGLSTAYMLLQQGYQVHIITRDDPRTTTSIPEFSSIFPAASIIPHSVNSDAVIETFKISKSYFEQLYFENFPGLKVIQHYELFCQNKPVPDYAPLMDDFQSLDEFRDEFYPDHPKHKVNSGWRFKTYFADWPVYFSFLIHEVLNKISGFKIKEITPNNLKELPFDLIINCTEIGSIDLFGDNSGKLIHRGHLISLPGASPLKDSEGNIVTYNFSPGNEIYESESGAEQDVYCYSRQDGLVLGGSRQKGYLNKHGQWLGELNKPPVMKVNDLELPSQIIHLNKQILRHSFNYDFPPVSRMQTKLGYRFTRSNDAGLRIEPQEIGDKLVIHNYGHGGAGVTLSWGCAKKAIELMKQFEN